ncbi:helix-turn-helix domain-containing protein [Ellagibacter isourolithinifaciens]|uniref:AlbA family DNA-binding domain-containing protein n=1 Tax=Ellagibacter isourolithinifaciens TaxID=2137581 RepID=UPI003A8FE325
MKRLPDSELIDTVVALSNTDGGVLDLGVEDDGTPTGIHEAHSDTTGLSALVSNKTMPPSPPEPPCCGSPRMDRRTRRACGSWPSRCRNPRRSSPRGTGRSYGG